MMMLGGTGKESLVWRFQNSSLMDKDETCRPLIFYSSGPMAGTPQPFPAPSSTAPQGAEGSGSGSGNGGRSASGSY